MPAVPVLDCDWTRLPLLAHCCVELTAGYSFIRHPSRQLEVRGGASASPEARLVLRSYGGLLLATALAAYLFYRRPVFDDATAAFALCMAFYHAFPIHRACARIRRRRDTGVSSKDKQAPPVLGGPPLHLAVHVACLVSLVGAVVIEKQPSWQKHNRG